MKTIISIAIEVAIFMAVVAWPDHSHVGGLPMGVILALGVSLGLCVVISKVIEIWIVGKALRKGNGEIDLSARLKCLLTILIVCSLVFFVAFLVVNMMDILANTAGELITMSIAFAVGHMGISFLIDLVLRFDIGSVKQLFFEM